MPESLYRRLTQVLGPETSERAFAALAGQRIYVPKRPRALAKDHKLRRFLGSGIAERLCQQFGGEAIDFPARPEPTPAKQTKSRALDLKAKGHPLNDIALLCGVSRRRVLQILAQNKAEGKDS